jgi:hypothetical protein
VDSVQRQAALRTLKGMTEEELLVVVRVLRLLREVRFGSVQIQVHEGEVVQVDVAQKVRLSPPAAASPPVRLTPPAGEA